MYVNISADLLQSSSVLYNRQVRTQYRTCTFRHLEDLEVVPHPPKGMCSFEHLGDLEVVPHHRNVILDA